MKTTYFLCIHQRRLIKHGHNKNNTSVNKIVNSKSVIILVNYIKNLFIAIVASTVITGIHITYRHT